MRFGNASHLYEGAMRRGRSERTLVGEGSDGWKGSEGQARLTSFELMKVGVVKIAVLV